MKITIDGKTYTAEENETILDVTKRNGIEIPATCFHPAVEAFGACRMCTVEITHPDWSGWTGYVTACLYPVTAGLQVLTSSAKVNKIRREVVDLLLARCPDTPAVKELAAKYGLNKSSYQPREKADDCILCGLCTRVCETLGFKAISTAGRGHDKYLATPLDQAPPDCTGCLSCAHICPTGHIKYSVNDKILRIWDREFSMQSCQGCGVSYLTEDYASALQERQGMAAEHFTKCDACRRQEQSEIMDRVARFESLVGEVK